MKPTRTNPQRRVRTAIYRLYNEAGALLYVGISDKPTRRWRQHEADKPWYPEVHASTVEWSLTRHEALRVEQRAIRIEGPRYNIEHRVPGATLTVVRQWLHAIGYRAAFTPTVWHEAHVDNAIAEVERLAEIVGWNDDGLEPVQVVDGLTKWWQNGVTVDEVPCFVLGTCARRSQHLRCSAEAPPAGVTIPAPAEPPVDRTS